MESEGFKNVFLTILTENRVMIHAAEQVSFASIGNNAHDRKTTHNEIKKWQDRQGMKLKKMK